jgi:hypothetical protein
MAENFFAKQIEVTTGGNIKVPVSFRLEGREYKISEVLESWPDYGYGNIPPQRKRWYHRHHRNYYRVKTTEGEIYEIYYDRGTKLAYPELKKWFLTRRL